VVGVTFFGRFLLLCDIYSYETNLYGCTTR
jgi:hypothetical protein